MAAERTTPSEHGVPLPLVPFSEYKPNLESKNWHHHFHPRTAPALSSESGGSIVRVARLQRAIRYGNHQAYHQEFVGPPLPHTTSEQLAVVILSRAGFVPEHGILPKPRGAARIVRLSPDQRNALIYGGQLSSGSMGETKQFLQDQILSQEFTDDKQTIDEFVSTSDPARRWFLGHLLLGRAMREATAPLDATYQRARKLALLPHYAPPGPGAFIWQTFRRAHERGRLLDGITKKLVA